MGLTYSDDGAQQVPGEDFDAARDVLQLLDADFSLREIARRVESVSKDQVMTIRDRRREYEIAAREADIEPESA